MALGIDFQNVDRDSFLAIEREHLLFPLAADVDYFSAASAHGGAQAVKDISASVVGDVIHRSAQADRPLIYGRRPTISTVDASGTSLAVTVRVVGRRFGRQITQDIVAAAGVGSQTVAGSRVIDEIVSMTIISISGNTTSDTLSVGFDDSWLGLAKPFRDRNALRMIMKSASGTPNSTGTRYSTDFTAAMVNLQDSAFDFKTLYSAALAVTDQYIVEYIAAAPGIRGFERKGKRFG